MKRNLLLRSYAIPVTICVIAWWVLLARHTGLTQYAVYPVLNNFPLLGLAALAIGVSVIVGELDLSVASVAAVAGMVSVSLQSVGIAGSILAACAAGAVFGALQGYLIVRLRIPSVVFTVATLIMLQGLAFTVSEQALLVEDLATGDVLARHVGPLSVSAALALGVFAAVGAFLALARVGREIYAVGGSRREALSAGVDVQRSVVTCFAISAGCAALAGSLAAYEGGSASPGSFNTILLLAVTAVLVGGVRFEGGRGTVIHIALGVAAMASVTAGMANQGQPGYVSQLVTGSLLIAVIGLGGLERWLTSRSTTRQFDLAASLTRIHVDGPAGAGLTSKE